MEDSISLISQPSSNWLKKRKRTMYIFLCESLFLGLESSVCFLTLWIYIETLVVTSHPRLVYSFAASAYLISDIILSLPIGSIVDKTRDVRRTFIICNTMIILGNIIYIINLSPICLILGRLISGCGGPLNSVIAGEIARCFSANETSRQFSKVGLAYSLGFVIGPGLNIIFKDIRFSVHSWCVTQANVPGLYMAVLFLILQIAVVCFVCNLSKEYDIKGIKEKSPSRKKEKRATNPHIKDYLIINQTHFVVVDANCEKRKSITETTALINTTSSILTMKTLFCNVDSLLICILSYLFLYVLLTLELWVPMMVIDVLQWDIFKLNLLILGDAILAGLGLVIIIYKPPSSRLAFWLIVLSILAMIILPAILYFINFFKSNLSFVILLWCLYVIFFSIGSVIEDVFLVNLLSQMVPSEKQTTSEGIRLAFGSFGSLTALLTSVYVFQYLRYFVVICSCLWTGVLLVFFYRRKHLEIPLYELEE